MTVRVSDLEPSEYQATLVGWSFYCKQQHRLYLAQLALHLLTSHSIISQVAFFCVLAPNSDW